MQTAADILERFYPRQRRQFRRLERRSVDDCDSSVVFSDGRLLVARRRASSVMVYPDGAARRKLIESVFSCHVSCRASMSRMFMLSKSHTATDFFPTEQTLRLSMASSRLVAVDDRSLSSMLPHNGMLTLWTPGAGIPVLRNLQNGAKPRYTGPAQI